MAKKVTAILTAAGTGSRFQRLSGSNSGTPKQFLRLFNKPVILYSLLVLQKCKAVDKIIITSQKKNFGILHNIISKYKITKSVELVEGGMTRAESVRNAFYLIKGSGSSLVLIHDAARPNISLRLINNIIGEAQKHGSTVIGIKISETVKRDKKGIVVETLNRENLWTVQTPQVFPYRTLLRSYEKIQDRKKLSFFTDESSLIENAGYKVRIIVGSGNNIKITTHEDLGIIKKLMIT